jgi:hypothetical protein
MEVWRDIPGIPSHQVSSIGRVRHKTKGNILKNHLTPNGYFYARFNKQTLTVNRLICLAFHGEPPTQKHQAAHNNGIRTDNRPDNIRWATREENYQDQILHGTSKKGEQHHLSKLTDKDVLKIRSLARAGMLQRSISEIFGIKNGAVSRIINYKRWAHI